MAIIEALLAATRVKDITVGYGQCGNLIQETIAAIRGSKKQTNEYLAKYGYGDARVTTVFHQWMGGFPQDEG